MLSCTVSFFWDVLLNRYCGPFLKNTDITVQMLNPKCQIIFDQASTPDCSSECREESIRLKSARNSCSVSLTDATDYQVQNMIQKFELEDYTQTHKTQYNPKIKTQKQINKYKTLGNTVPDKLFHPSKVKYERHCSR